MRPGKLFFLFCLTMFSISCDNEQSLQEYFVANQENKDFIAIDIPASLFAKLGTLNPDQEKTLKSVKKVNFLAVAKKPENMEVINSEREKMTNILKDEKYQLLMKYGGGDTRMELYFTGDEEAVDEVIIYGYDENRGVGIARVLGNDMNPGEVMEFITSLKAGDLNMQGLEGVAEMFGQTKE